MRFLSALLLSMLTTVVGAAPRWVPVGSNDEAQVWIDTKSIRKMTDPEAMQLWARIKYNKVFFTKNGQKYDTIERISVYNCEEKTRRAVMEVYFFKGVVVDAGRGTESHIIPIDPDNAIGSKAYSLACTR